MEDSTKLNTVVVGEASESDEETEKPNELNDAIATVVSGEATESEDEEEVDGSQSSITPLRENNDKLSNSEESTVDPESKGDRDDIISAETSTQPVKITEVAAKAKYDTLLHRKLRERNVALRRHLSDSVRQAYLSCSKNLHNTSQQLHKTQSVFLDVNFNMRNLTNDLFKLEDTVDIIASCNLMPDINIEVPASTS